MKSIKKAFKKFFRNKNWKEIKTRKIMLVLSIGMIILYTVVGIVLLGKNIALDATLTEQYFSYAKWIVISGAAITMAKVVKGKTNSDSDEDIDNIVDDSDEIIEED